jgi:hypothetical protein
VQDRFEKLGKTRELTAFFATVPAKVLSNGLDLLVSNYFRGGFDLWVGGASATGFFFRGEHCFSPSSLWGSSL